MVKKPTSFLQLFRYATEGDVKRLRELIMIETAKNQERERRKKQSSKGEHMLGKWNVLATKYCPSGGSAPLADAAPHIDAEFSAKPNSAAGFNIDEYRDFGDNYGTALHCAVYCNQVFED